MLKLLTSTNQHRNSFVEQLMLSNNPYFVAFMLKQVNTKDDAIHFDIISMVKRMIKGPTTDTIVQLVIQKLIEYDMLRTHINTFMLCALHQNKFNLVRYLLWKGADPLHVDEHQKTLVCHLMEKQQLKLIELLVDHYNVDINSVDKDGINIIFIAVEQKACAITSYLIMNGTHLNCKDHDGALLIERCIQHGWYLHVTHIISQKGFAFVEEEELFHRYCNLALEVNSVLIFDKLIKTYFAYKIQRSWRNYRLRAKLAPQA